MTFHLLHGFVSPYLFIPHQERFSPFSAQFCRFAISLLDFVLKKISYVFKCYVLIILFIYDQDSAQVDTQKSNGGMMKGWGITSLWMEQNKNSDYSFNFVIPTVYEVFLISIWVFFVTTVSIIWPQRQ